MNYKTVNMNQSPNEIEIERLLAMLNHEEQMKNSVEQSYNDLLNASKELEKRIAVIEQETMDFNKPKVNNKNKNVLAYEGNEWKTRFENQEEINRHLRKQINQLEEKLEETKTRSKNISRKIMNEQNKENLDGQILMLIKTKESLQSELKDYGWRMEQEMKSYHKANEERKNIHQEILDTRSHLNLIKEKNEHNKSNKISNTNEQLTARKPIDTKQTSQAAFLPNIPSSYNGSNYRSDSSRIFESPTRKSDSNVANETPNETQRTQVARKNLSSRSSLLY